MATQRNQSDSSLTPSNQVDDLGGGVITEADFDDELIKEFEIKLNNAHMKALFLKKIKPYVEKKTNQAFKDGYRYGYFERATGKPERYESGNDLVSSDSKPPQHSSNPLRGVTRRHNGMSNEELEQAYDEVCNSCDLATRNSNDGGKMPCNNHKLLYMKRTEPVIHMDNFWDGEWTHSAVDTQSIAALIMAILEDFKEKDTTPSDYVSNLGISVIQMTKDEFKEIPEL